MFATSRSIAPRHFRRRTLENTFQVSKEERSDSLFSILFVIFFVFAMSHMNMPDMNMPHHYNPQIRPTFDIFDRHGTSHDLGEISRSINTNMVSLSDTSEFNAILSKKIGDDFTPEGLMTMLNLDENSKNAIKKAFRREYFSKKPMNLHERLHYYRLGPSDTIKQLAEKILEDATSSKNEEEVKELKEKLDSIGRLIHDDYSLNRNSVL